MKLYFLGTCIGVASFLQTLGPGELDQGIGQLFSKEQYQRFFPHHHVIYTYESLIKAAKSFPLFADEGSLLNRKRELIAFMANIAHETANNKDGTYSWGLYYTEEQACIDGQCPQYNVAGASNFKPVAGKS